MCTGLDRIRFRSTGLGSNRSSRLSRKRRLLADHGKVRNEISGKSGTLRGRMRLLRDNEGRISEAKGIRSMKTLLLTLFLTVTGIAPAQTPQARWAKFDNN